MPVPDEQTDSIIETATPAYFATLGIGLREGRLLSNDDRWSDVCLVNEAFVRRYFRHRPALGTTVGFRQERLMIVGVVENVRQVNLRGDPPEILYRPARGYDGYLSVLQIRTAAAPAATAEAVRAVIREVEPRLAVGRGFATIAESIERATALERILGRLTTCFAVVAVVLAAVGLYGVLAYLVRQRTAEIGVRQALGASRSDVIRLIMRQAFGMVVAGIVIGLAGTLALGRGIAGMLYGISPTDPVAIGSALLALLAAGPIASYLPARQAARVNPLEALRYE